ncbi:ATP-binding protein [Desulfosediminicola sp.]|uniref:ATP-binding protein n=1 Tax=Desulfosediminicola sp. TaxID=2886825 RepID=UPI003AF2F329
MITAGGIRAKFVLLAFFCVFCTVASISYKVFDRERNLLEKNTEQQALLLAKSSAILFINALVYEEIGIADNDDITEFLDFYVSDVMAMDSRIKSFMVFDRELRVVSHDDLKYYGTQLKASKYRQVLNSSEDRVERFSRDGWPILEVLVPLAIESKNWGGCRIIFSLSEIEAASRDLLNKILAAAAVALLTSLIIIGFAAEYFIRPIKRLSDRMEQMTSVGDVSTPMPDLPARNDEIGQLQQSFSWMVTRLQKEEQRRRQTLEKLLHTEKMASVGQLTASIAHEINNPLGGVILCFNNLVDGKLDEKSRQQHIEVIQQSLDRMRDTMRGLLDYSRQPELTLQRVSIAEVIVKSTALLETMLRRRGIGLEVNLEEGLPLMSIDSLKIQQVIVNLLLNGAHAIERRQQACEGGVLRIEARQTDDSVLLSVSDNGHGVPGELQEKIFKLFFSTMQQGKGTGLGLAVSRSIAEQHGGRLWLSESSADGSTFTLSLHIEDEADGEQAYTPG